MDKPPQQSLLQTLTCRLEVLDLSQLRAVRYRLGELLHMTLLNDKIGILCNSGIAPGMDADALASNDNSSTYLGGGFIRYSVLPDDLKTYASKAVIEGFNLVRNAGLQNCQLIVGAHGYASGEHAGEMVAFVGDQGATMSERVILSPQATIKPEDKRKAIQEVSAIITIYQIMIFLDVIQSTNNQVNDLLLNSRLIEDPLMNDVQNVEIANNAAWREIFPLLKEELNGGKISIGESFTCGLLANLMTSIEGSMNVLDTYLNWYDSLLKAYVGVPTENLAWDRIAEPDTIALASEGLFNKASLQSTTTIGTTGYANYWEAGKPDYFSIGVSSKGSDSSISTITAKVEVKSSKDMPRSWGRRQLTRHLGATVALYLLCQKMATKNHQFEKISANLKNKIEKYCGEMQLG